MSLIHCYLFLNLFNQEPITICKEIKLCPAKSESNNLIQLKVIVNSFLSITADLTLSSNRFSTICLRVSIFVIYEFFLAIVDSRLILFCN